MLSNSRQDRVGDHQLWMGGLYGSVCCMFVSKIPKAKCPKRVLLSLSWQSHFLGQLRVAETAAAAAASAAAASARALPAHANAANPPAATDPSSPRCIVEFLCLVVLVDGVYSGRYELSWSKRGVSLPRRVPKCCSYGGSETPLTRRPPLMPIKACMAEL